VDGIEPAGRLGFGEELTLVEHRVEPAPLEKLGVGSLLDQPPAIQDKDRIGGQDGGQAVRNNDRGPPSEEPCEGDLRA
jgi:hypothetical protein